MRRKPFSLLVLLYLLILILIAGCNLSFPLPVVTSTPNLLLATSSPSHTSTVSYSPILTSTPSRTKTSTPSPLPSRTPTATPLPTLVEVEIPPCNGYENPLPPPDDFGFKGSLILHVKNQPYFSSMGGFPLVSTPLMFSLPASSFSAGLSPDGKWLAFYENTTVSENENLQPLSFIMFFSTGETITQTIDISPFAAEVLGGFYLGGLYIPSFWIYNRLIYFSLEMVTYPVGSLNILPMVRIFDPYQGIWRNGLIADIPYFRTYYMTGYSPDLQRVLYEYNSEGLEGLQLVLWDLQAKKEIWRDSEFPIIRGAIVQWAPDSSYAAYTNYVAVQGEDRRVFLIAHNGGQRQPITSASYPVPDFRYHSFSWSPNSRYLALVGESVDYSHPELTTLFIYDHQYNQYIYQCPLPDFHPFMEILWSPDNRYLAYYHSTANQLELLDRKTGLVIDLLPNAIPYGWSAEFPFESPK